MFIIVPLWVLGVIFAIAWLTQGSTEPPEAPPHAIEVRL